MTQDFNYLFSNCMEITVELSCCKYPMEDTLQGHWEDNKEALLAYVEAVQTGLRGIVKDAKGEPVGSAGRPETKGGQGRKAAQVGGPGTTDVPGR